MPVFRCAIATTALLALGDEGATTVGIETAAGGDDSHLWESASLRRPHDGRARQERRVASHLALAGDRSSSEPGVTVTWSATGASAETRWFRRTIRCDTPTVLLRRERPSDIASIARIHHQAFGALDIYDGNPPVEDRLVDALRADPAWTAALSIVAEDDAGTVVGHVVASEGRLGDVPAVGIGPLGVLPERQGLGVGAALMHAVIAAADALEYPVAALLGDPAYYARFGFVPAASLHIDAVDESWGKYFQVRALGSYAGETGTFHYAAPFAAL